VGRRNTGAADEPSFKTSRGHSKTSSRKSSGLDLRLDLRLVRVAAGGDDFVTQKVSSLWSGPVRPARAAAK
jgi:hypothetical protein